MPNELEKKVISQIQGDLPGGRTPFAEAAARIGISEEEFLSVIRNLKDKGVIRWHGMYRMTISPLSGKSFQVSGKSPIAMNACGILIGLITFTR
jgi:hypothetical protein